MSGSGVAAAVMEGRGDPYAPVWEAVRAARVGPVPACLLFLLWRERLSRPNGGWLSKREIASEGEVSTKTVQLHLQALIDTGLVVRRTRRESNAGSSLPTLYRINITPDTSRYG